MKNKHEITGDVAFVEVVTKGITEVIQIDRDTVERLKGRSIWKYTGKYYGITVNNKSVSLHRFICGAVSGDGKVIDHLDGDTKNNLRSNLSVGTQKDNMQNQRKAKLYSYDTNKQCWTVEVTRDGKRNRWRFKTEEEAQIKAQEVKRRFLK